MSFFDDASLAFLPSGAAGKDGKAYSIKPTNGDGDFTFSRGSNLSATRVGADGLIEKGRENLLLQSNNFGTTWITPDATITSGQADKDGSNNAWLLTATSAFNRVTQSVSQSGVKRFSVYAKANTNDYLLLGSVEGAHFYATFNLATGAVDSNNINAISPSIENVGNGWYRCSATWVGTTTEVRIASQATSGQGGWASTTSGSVLIQDAQLEVGLAATEVIESGASTGKAGLLEDEPRFDYSGGATCPSLLLEPSRTNINAYSEYFLHSQAIYTNASGIANVEISPEGVQNAHKLLEDTANARHRFYITGASAGAGNIVVSAFLKDGNRGYGALHLDTGTDGRYTIIVNLSNGTIVDTMTFGTPDVVSEGVEPYGNGWYRAYFVLNKTSAANVYPQIGLASSDSDANSSGMPSYQGDGTHYIYCYGLQLEQGSYPTSYIPTYGSAVTRSKDSCVSSSLTTSTDFTIFFEAPNFCLINGGVSTSYNNIQFVFSDNGNAYSTNGSYHIYSNSLFYYDGANAFGYGAIFNNQTDSKFVIMKRGDKVLVFANGAKKTEATLPSGVDASIWDTIKLTESLEDSQGDVFGSNYKQLLKFDTALTDSECITLTTI